MGWNLNCNSQTDMGLSQATMSNSDVGKLFLPINKEASRKARHPIWYNLIGCKKISPAKFSRFLGCIKHKGRTYAKKCSPTGMRCLLKHPFMKDQWCRRQPNLPDIKCPCSVPKARRYAYIRNQIKSTERGWSRAIRRFKRLSKRRARHQWCK